MNCTEFEREWQELDDPGLFSPALDGHLQACAGCARLVREVNLLRWEARQLVEAEQPPARLWANIQGELSREGVLRVSDSWLNGILTFAWLPRLPMSVAYASVFFLALVGVEYVRDQTTPPTVAVSSAPAAPAEAPAPAREEEKVIQRVIEKASPERRPVLIRDLQQVNDSVNELQRFHNQHPDDLDVLWQLHEAQEQQRRFFEQIMRWEEF